MKSNILQFKGLYGDQHPSAFPGLVIWEPLEVRSKLYNWEIEEHVHEDIVQLFFITQGKGLLKTGKERRSFEGPCLLFIPSNHLHGFSFQPPIAGEVLSISADYLEKSLETEPQVLQSLQEILILKGDEPLMLFSQLLETKQQFIKEWQEENEQKSLAMKAHFLLLFTHIYRLFAQQTGNLFTEDKRSLQYFQQFKKLIRKNLAEHWSIPQYALQLGISRVHLNRICKEISGESAHQVIENQFVTDAKNYLLSSSYSISEVAYLLNFKDPAYFTRVFKRATGVAPSEFQKN